MRSIIYLPGFNSGPQSEKSVILAQAFPGLRLADYDTWNTAHGYEQLESLIQPLLVDKPILIGSSLGGFWAYQFACKYQLPCLLINPCMHPENTLSQYIGKVENFYTHKTGIFTEQDVARFADYRFVGSPAACTVLHEKGDELIPYQESMANFSGRARLILPEGGNHRFAQVQLILDEIKLMCEQDA